VTRSSLNLRLKGQWSQALERWGALSGLQRDAALFAISAVFAFTTWELSGIALYRQWGLIALWGYGFGAIAALVLAHYIPREKARLTRLLLSILVGTSAMLLPLSLEVAWRHGAAGGDHVQPEVVVVEHAGGAAAKGHDPYQEVVRHGRVVGESHGRPVYERFFPYLPLMSVFGLPSTAKAPVELTDARILFSCATLALVAVALALSLSKPERKLRVAQVLLVLPTAALPLATGGDDMPVVAMMLLGVVLAARRRHAYAGLALGIAMAMKFTAWPLGLLALLASRGAKGQRKIWPMLLGEAVAFVPGVLWALHRGPSAFIQNVVEFPLGLAGVSSPAASALPGHILVTWFPALHRLLPLAAAAIGAIVLVAYIWRKRPSSVAQICRLSAWVMTMAICLAPATRVGYLLYPLNLFTWAWLVESDSSTTAELVEPQHELR